MRILSLAVAAAALAVVPFASVGSASAMSFSYDYTNSQNPAGGPSLSCNAFGIFNNSCSVTFNNAGLGVNGSPDSQPDQIDGSPVFSSERLTFDFGFDRVWDTLELGRWDSNDDLRLIWDGGTTTWGPSAPSTVALGGVVSQYLTVVAYGQFWVDGFFRGNDSFTVAKLHVSSVPVPAALPLLAGGLGILGFAGWRRKRTQTS